MKPTRLCVAISVLFLAGAAHAADPVHERQDAMKGAGDAMKTLNAIAKKEAPFDPTIVGRKAWIIAEHLKTAATLFPAGSDSGETRAKPEIWTSRADFDKTFKDGYAAAVTLQSITDEPSYAAAHAALAVSCKNCHEQYRVPPKK